MKKYQIIYSDPPWRYDFSKSGSRKIENQYSTMELEDIKNLQVPSDDNSVLYLWATTPKLVEALEVMKAWGFTYKSHAIWDKDCIGMGYWFRGQHELLLVGTKGNFSPPKAELRKSSIVKIKRGEHSSKPDYFKTLIDLWYPEMDKLEMFARDRTPLLPKPEKWSVWGNEVTNDVEIISGQPVPVIPEIKEGEVEEGIEDNGPG